MAIVTVNKFLARLLHFFKLLLSSRYIIVFSYCVKWKHKTTDMLIYCTWFKRHSIWYAIIFVSFKIIIWKILFSFSVPKNRLLYYKFGSSHLTNEFIFYSLSKLLINIWAHFKYGVSFHLFLPIFYTWLILYFYLYVH